MNLNPLYELKERLEASIVAGVSLLSEDFRLKRAVEQMEPLSKAAPVFGKIFQAAQELFLDSCKNKGNALLDVLGLVDAVLVTQAAAEVEGELEPIALVGWGSHSHAPYSLLAPALEALSTTGGGHYNLIVEAHGSHPEIFSDYRLKAALVDGLGAGYAELAEQVERWLCEEDASLLPALKSGFDPKGKKEMARRVHVVEAIAGAEENDWYFSVIQQGEKDVKAAAIYALRHCQENQDQLIGLTKTEKGDCKKAAFWALSEMEGKENQEFWETQLKKKPTTAVKYLALSASDAASDLVADAISHMLDRLQAQLDGANATLSNEDYGKLQPLLAAMVGKASPKMLDIYRELASDSILGQMKTEKGEPVQFDNNDIQDKRMAMPVSHYIAKVLRDSILWSMDGRLLSLAEELYQSRGTLFLKPALVAALLTKPKEEVYGRFSPLLAGEEGAKKESGQQRAEQLDIMGSFAWVMYDRRQGRYVIHGQYYDERKDKAAVLQRELFDGLDPRWFELFTSPGLKKSGHYPSCHGSYGFQGYNGYYSYGADWDAVLERLICPADQEACQTLSRYFHRRLVTSKASEDDRRLFALLGLCGFQDGQGFVVKSLQKKTAQYWAMEDMVEKAPMPLPDKLEELKEVKKLVDSGKISITGWSEERYQRFYDKLSMGLEDGQGLAEMEG